MTEIEQLRRNTEKAYQAALKAMLELVDAITAERNYYRRTTLGPKEEKLARRDSQNIIKRF